MSDVRDVAASVARTDALQRCGSCGMLNVPASLSRLPICSSPWISALETKGELSLHGVWFDIALGELHVIDPTSGAWVNALNVIS